MKKKNTKLIKTKILMSSVFLLSLLSWLVWGNVRLKISHLKIEDVMLPKSFNGYKIGHISDLHNKDWGNRLSEKMKGAQPDIIVITGDLVDSTTNDFSIIKKIIAQMVEIAPIYYVSGNHEARNSYYPDLEEILIEQGVTVLNNEKVILRKDQKELTLLGLQDPSFTISSNWLKEEETYVDTILEELTQDSQSYKVLLSHRPELFDIYVQQQVNLVFSGHAHGGQVRVPLIGGLVAPNQGFFPNYTAGLYRENQTSMIVSRGLGHSILPLRVNNPTELVFVELSNPLYNK